MTHSLDRFAYTLPNELCAEIRKLVSDNKIMRELLYGLLDANDSIQCSGPNQTKVISELHRRSDIVREALKAIEGKK